MSSQLSRFRSRVGMEYGRIWLPPAPAGHPNFSPMGGLDVSGCWLDSDVPRHSNSPGWRMHDFLPREIGQTARHAPPLHSKLLPMSQQLDPLQGVIYYQMVVESLSVD